MTKPSYHFDWQAHQGQLLSILQELEELDQPTQADLVSLVNQHPKLPGQLFKKSELLKAYRELAGTHGLAQTQPKILKILRKKPIRTASGVTVVTVLTKPYPCPGECIFCPNDIRMPKSYLAEEPGAQRAEKNFFDPYLQTYNRLEALQQIGHHLDKIELIVLGGTWSFYPESYQIWFIKECFRALNEFDQTDSRPEVLNHYQQMNQRLREMDEQPWETDYKKHKAALADRQIEGKKINQTYNQVISELYLKPEKVGGFDRYQTADWEELEHQQKINETAQERNVGLVLETRPDRVTPKEVLRLRRLGATKVQLGFQSLDDRVLALNKRGHDVAATKKAIALLRRAGFKIHGHWMANLYGSSVEQDKADYQKMFVEPDFRPDELKIYPCSLLQTAELMQLYQAGQYHPYTQEELLEVISYVLTHTPEYCRLTRVIRDIPSTEIVEGNKKTNFRQIARQHLEKIGAEMKDIRAREIRDKKFDPKQLVLKELSYETRVSEEKFLQFVLPQENQPDKIVAFLRLSLPEPDKGEALIEELTKSAIIREIHVYGQTVQIGQEGEGKPQHAGFGTRLIKRAKELANEAGYKKLAVISAVGTREYYRKKGFSDGQLYQWLML